MTHDKETAPEAAQADEPVEFGAPALIAQLERVWAMMLEKAELVKAGRLSSAEAQQGDRLFCRNLALVLADKHPKARVTLPVVGRPLALHWAQVRGVTPPAAAAAGDEEVVATLTVLCEAYCLRVREKLRALAADEAALTEARFEAWKADFARLAREEAMIVLGGPALRAS